MYHQLIMTDTSPVALITGLQDGIMEDALNATAKNYGFHYVHIGGCVNTRKLNDSILAINEVIYGRMQKKYGPGWLASFRSQVRIVMPLQAQAKKLLENNRAIIETNTAFQRQGIDIAFEITPNFQTKRIDINAFAWQNIDRTFQKVLYYTAVMDSGNSNAVIMRGLN